MTHETHEIDLGDDDGYVLLKLAGQEFRKDLYELHNSVVDYQQKHAKAGALDYNAGLIALLQEKGLPEMSQHQAARLVKTVIDRVAELKKKLSGTPGSPASTASTPSP